MKYSPSTVPPSPRLIVLVRNLKQLEATLTAGIETIYCEFEDPRKYKQAVEIVRQSYYSPSPKIWVAPPRITKPAENWILQQVRFKSCRWLFDS